MHLPCVDTSYQICGVRHEGKGLPHSDDTYPIYRGSDREGKTHLLTLSSVPFLKSNDSIPCVVYQLPRRLSSLQTVFHLQFLSKFYPPSSPHQPRSRLCDLLASPPQAAFLELRGASSEFGVTMLSGSSSPGKLPYNATMNLSRAAHTLSCDTPVTPDGSSWLPETCWCSSGPTRISRQRV